MAFQWSQRSRQLLEGLCPELRRVVDRALGFRVLDLTIVETVRSRERQEQLFADGKSRVQWPYSKHNVTTQHPLARAVDVAPCVGGRLSWDSRHCLVMAGIVLAAAKAEGVHVRWGGNWDEDDEPITDQDFQDLVHFELGEP